MNLLQAGQVKTSQLYTVFFQTSPENNHSSFVEFGGSTWAGFNFKTAELLQAGSTELVAGFGPRPGLCQPLHYIND